MANNVSVNYDDERFGQVESDKKQAMTELEQTYGGMIEKSDDFYQAQIDASKQWADKQSQIQQEQTDFTIEKIEQQKEQAHKDYLKEQSGAYADWRKQSNEYGPEAEKMATAGLAATGFSESSQVNMYTAYQNRVAIAREVMAQATLNYDNAIKDARLQNNAALAEIALQAYIKQTELALEGFQYENQLILDRANKKIELDNIYHNRYLDVLNQINHENAMAEEIRQFNQQYNLQLNQYKESIRQFNEEIARLKKKDDEESRMQAEELELRKQQLEEEKRQFDEQMALKKNELSGSPSPSPSPKPENVTKLSGPASAVVAGATATNLGGTGPMTVVNSPLTPEGAAARVASGELNATQIGSKIYVTRNPSYTKGQSLLDKYTGLGK